MYGELVPQSPMRRQKITTGIDAMPDDFYIINDYEEGIAKSDIYTTNEEIDFIPTNDDGSVEMVKPPYQQLKWFHVPEKVYQYTKHRIPGYDYDELDFTGSRKFNKCDASSVWSHCVCQFTCSNPNEVDCYMPCHSGCECKEAYVFDESTQRCVLPEMCPRQDNYDMYKK